MDLLDYVAWRGDLSFSQVSLCSVDSLILCQLSYLNFRGIVGSSFEEGISLNEAAALFAGAGFEKRRELGLLINPKTVDLLFECAKSRRFGALVLCGFVDSYSQKEEEQFSALTFLSQDKNGFAFVAFRGTDDMLIGWKEDFNLAFKAEVKAQADALSYLEKAASKKIIKKLGLVCGGHSKGGNLAIFAGAKLSQKNQRRLAHIYNFDGPGFLKKVILQSDFISALNKTSSFFPEESIVGMLFEHDSRFDVVKSNAKSVNQHDPFSWQTCPFGFELCEKLSASSLFLNEVFNEWFAGLSVPQREQFVETLFSAIESTGAKTNTELAENWGKSGTQIIKAFYKLNKDIRDSALSTAFQFIKLAGGRIPDYLKKKWF